MFAWFMLSEDREARLSRSMCYYAGLGVGPPCNVLGEVYIMDPCFSDGISVHSGLA